MLTKALPILEQFKGTLKFLEWGSNVRTKEDEAFLRKHCADRDWMCTYSYATTRVIVVR